MKIPIPLFQVRSWVKLFIGTLLLSLLVQVKLFAQTYTLSTVPPYSSNNGSSAITFNVQTYSQAVTITEISCAFSASSNVEIWYRTTPITAAPTIPGAGWVSGGTAASFTVSALPTPSILPIPLSITIPANTTYGFCVSSGGSLQYLTGTVAPTQINDTRINIINDPGAGFGGTLTGWIANRQFCGSVKYNIATGGSSVLPPIANFFPSQSNTSTIPNDTVWINSPFDLVSTSTNTTRTYWDLPGVNPLLPGYNRSAVGFTAQQYIDTAKYNKKFRYTYNTRGFWPVRLLAINNLKSDSLRDSVVRYIWVDTPSTVPTPNFFAARRIIGIGDYASLLDISSGGPNQWLWSYDPPCNLCSSPPYFPNFYAGMTDQNPLFFAGDPGKFTLCLQVWNARGWDTICKKDYIEVVNSINICSGSGAGSSTEKQGFIFGPSGTGLSYTRSQVSGCPGFLLEPCADSIIFWVDRIKMLPSDTLVIHNGTSSAAPVLRKIGGANVSTLPASIVQNGIRGGSRLFVRFQLGTQAVPTPYDSAGFSIRWEIKPASYGKPVSRITIQDTIFSLQPVPYSNASIGTLMQFAWDTDGNGVYDSSGATATRNFLITTPSYKKICLVTYNCVGSDTSCKFVLFLPTTQKPTARFEANKVQGFNTDTFRFTDKSLFGPGTWKWTFTPATAQYLMGTSSTSKNPIMRFTQRTLYTVKLAVTNQYGADSISVLNYINIGAYEDPFCVTDISLSDGSIGISRVRLENGIDTFTNAISPCFQIVGGNQAANMYRGRKHALSVARPATSTAMDRKAWIDFNMDGVFSSDETVMSEMNGTSLLKIDTILVSNTQRLGGTRMRVGVTLATTELNPSKLFLGVFRDYTVNFPMDTVKPLISLNGTNPFYTEIHKPFVDPGVTCTDNFEGNISAKYETIGTVDTSKVGPNYLKYIVRDLYGNVSDTLLRTVFVILNQSGPVITLDTPTTVYVEVYNKFKEPGFKALDNRGGIISDQVVITSNLDTSKLGAYSNTYTIVDAFGLADSKQRFVNVGDTTRPVVTPKGIPFVHQVKTAIDITKVVDVTDNYWKGSFIQLNTLGTVDVNNVGSYFVSYTAKDNSNNTSNPVMVRIDVKDTKAPTLILNGVTPMNWEVKQQFVNPGVSVTDNYWPNSTVVVSIKGTVNTNVLGEYTIWYIGTDPSGNKDSISRIVKVVDSTKPVVDLLNVTEVQLERWKVYVDAPVSLVDNYNTDAQMRTTTNFFVVNNLPLNSEGKPFGDVPGLFSVRYKCRDLSNNESDEKVRRIYVGAVGVNEVMNIDNLMSVYPNPGNGLVNIRLADVQSQDVSVSVLDMLGKEITHFNMKGNNLQVHELDLTKQPKGIYFLRVKTGSQVYSKKLQITE